MKRVWLDLIAKLTKASTPQKILAIVIPMCILVVGYLIMDYVERR